MTRAVAVVWVVFGLLWAGSAVLHALDGKATLDVLLRIALGVQSFVIAVFLLDYHRERSAQ